VQRTFAYHDSIVRFILPLCSAVQQRPEPELPILSGVYLVDASSFGLKQAWDVRAYAEEISHVLGMSFPEVVHTVYVLDAPSYFSKIWGFLKGWVNPRTASKLVVVPKSKVLSTLTQSMDHSGIPVQFGGSLAFKHGELPRLDEGVRGVWGGGEEEKEVLPPGPMKWRTSPDGRIEAVALGTVKGEARREVIATLKRAHTEETSALTNLAPS
jgi:hypothetical protein